MFGNKKRIKSLRREVQINYDANKEMDWELAKSLDRIIDQLQAIEEYLNIEYKEETTKGYVKKVDKKKK